MTSREMIGLHAEILALRDTLGISYKDACHRLYMTEWEKLKMDEAMYETFSSLRRQTRDAMVDFQTKLAQLDGKLRVPSSSASASALPTAPLTGMGDSQ
jgi:hypothetical protein